MIKIEDQADVHRARRKARKIAKDEGFNSKKYLLLEISVSELATNIIKHAQDGKIIIKSTKKGLKVIAKDNGPGIRNTDKILRKSKKKKRGLSSVYRIMDEVDIKTEEGEGTYITSEMWKGVNKKRKFGTQDVVLEKGLMEYGAISIPASGQTHKGDGYIILEHNQKVFISVIDGLGHGKEAAKASDEIKSYLLENYTDSLTSLLKKTHRNLKSKRGGVVGLIKLDLKKSTLSCAGVGNIRVRIVGEEEKRHLFPPGTIGRDLKNVRRRTLPYNKDSTVIIYSDGISSNFDSRKIGLEDKDLQEVAEYVSKEHGKPEDDRTVIISRESDNFD